MYKDVKLSDGLFSAIEAYTDSNGIIREVDVLIEKSISQIYIVNGMHHPAPLYSAITYANKSILDAISTLFKGEATVATLRELTAVKVRFGWMDKHLNSLHWVSMIELYRKYIEGNLTAGEKNKLTHILMMISLSKKDILKMDEKVFSTLYAEAFPVLTRKPGVFRKKASAETCAGDVTYALGVS